MLKRKTDIEWNSQPLRYSVQIVFFKSNPLGHSQWDSLTKPMLITAFNDINPKVTRVLKQSRVPKPSWEPICAVNFSNNISRSGPTWKLNMKRPFKPLNSKLKDKYFHDQSFFFKFISLHNWWKFSDLQSSYYWEMYLCTFSTYLHDLIITLLCRTYQRTFP